MKRKYSSCRFRALCVTVSLLFIFPQIVSAVPIFLSEVPGYGYNTVVPPDGNPGIIGCGPTTAAMILDYYDNTVAPGLVVDPLADARLLHDSYMNVNAAGFGAPSDFQFGFENFASDRGYVIDAKLHVEPTTFNHADWSDYTVGDDIVLDANFWNPSTWDILEDPFLTFIGNEIDAGRPFCATVDSDGNNTTDHWMVGVGYDLEAKKWAGYTTWDNQLHWYDVNSAFTDNTAMGVGFIRTFEFIPQDVPEPSILTIFLNSFIFLIGFGCIKSRLRVNGTRKR